ncbi:MAG: rhomboid family intramembrane serine protease [Clostridiales bacterium]|nr:rhomboid family intramembrane serine protease [Clostridiales bacterium]MCD7754693.1 rhomboid family intramembrane serine protease [Clostridiales bacterium]MCD7801484.1 rhomboid family intramembrane serine protease [Clostridiales bacterium]MCD8384734.1 rhomboid family intramembrane serine protease [Clostridiales bacterium]
MNRLNNLIERFCYQHPRFGVPNLVYYLIGGSAIVYVLDLISYSGVAVSSMLSFDRALIFQGQVWRLITFVFTTWGEGIIYFLLGMYFLWFIGTNLEREWGTAKFNCYYFLGLILTVVVGLFTGSASTSYLEMTLFLAFATLYPDARFLLFFFIPIKAKWLGYIEGGLLAISLVMSLISLDVGGALCIVVSVLNYLIFFWPELVYQVNRLRGRANHARQPNVIQFKKASRDLKKQNYTHKCTVCGRTDVDYPDLEFRYCSRCAGYHCYCLDHINNHVHITEE